MDKRLDDLEDDANFHQSQEPNVPMIYRQEMYESEGHLLKVLTEDQDLPYTNEFGEVKSIGHVNRPQVSFHGQAQLEIRRGQQSEVMTFWFPIADACTIPQAFERYEACAKVAAQARMKQIEDAALKQALASPKSPLQLPTNGRFKR